MTILVSACLLGENCKYSGGNNRNEKIIEFCKGHDVIAVCPEQLGGLPTPRVPAEIVNGVVRNRDGVSVDREFRLGAEKAIEMIGDRQVDLAILQSRSPSCVASVVYDGTFSGTLIPGQGVFATRLSEMGIPIKESAEFE